LAIRGAAERAIQLRSFDQAMSYFLQALAVTDDPLEQATLKERAADAATNAGRYPEAARLADEAAQEHRLAGDLIGAGRATAQGATAMLFDGRAVEVIESLTSLLADIDALHDPAAEPTQAAITSQLSRALMLDGAHERAIELADRAIVLAERLGEVEIAIDTLVTKGSSVGVFREQEGMAILLGAVRLAQIHGLTRVEFRARNNVMIKVAMVDAPAALDIVEGGIELARRTGHRDGLLSFIGSSVSNHYYLGDWSTALQVLDELERDDLPVAVHIEAQWTRMEHAAACADPAAFATARARAEADLETMSSSQRRLGHEFTLAWADYAAGHFREGVDRIERFEHVGWDEDERAISTGRLAMRLGDADRVRRAIAQTDEIASRSPFMTAARRRSRLASQRSRAVRMRRSVATRGDRRMDDLGYLLESSVMRLEFAAVVGSIGRRLGMRRRLLASSTPVSAQRPMSRARRPRRRRVGRGSQPAIRRRRAAHAFDGQVEGVAPGSVGG
jgi:tetratricopeptide (TPR) repeat protein